MNRHSKISLMILIFFGISASFLFLNYGAGITDSKRMNFVFMAFSVGTGLALALGFVFPHRLSAALIRLSHIIWAIATTVAIGSILIIAFCFLGKYPLPFWSEQWYGVILVLGFIGAFMQRGLGESYNEVYRESFREDTSPASNAASSPA